jgi:hypothetical protein
MTNVLQNALTARLRSIDWYYGYSDDYTVWAREKRKIDTLSHDISQLPLEQIQEMLGEQHARPDNAKDTHAISLLENVIILKTRKS